jgi:hypothetical protein
MPVSSVLELQHHSPPLAFTIYVTMPERRVLAHGCENGGMRVEISSPVSVRQDLHETVRSAVSGWTMMKSGIARPRGWAKIRRKKMTGAVRKWFPMTGVVTPDRNIP